MKIKWKILLANVAVPLAVGALSGLLTRNAMKDFMSIAQPALSPPPWLFPIVWTLLFTLMGISAYLVTLKRSSTSDMGMERFFDVPRVYWLQLAVNFVWPLIFFNMSMYLAALVWLIILIVLVIFMILAFSSVTPLAGRLQIPYLLWLFFAAYLNAGVWLLN